MFVEYTGTEEVLKALADIGRTEDVQFSPDGKRLAIAGFYENRILILEVEKIAADPAWTIRFSRATIVRSEVFAEPHGLAWVDDEVLLVANRKGLVPVIRVPRFVNAPELFVHPIHMLGGSEADFIDTPGSVSLRALGPDLLEVLICNNYIHTVTRHHLSREGLSVLSSETVFRKGLNVPDGAVFSHSGEWVAISNHYDNSVFIYRANDIGFVDQPAGMLRGMGFPHGISFTPDDRALFAADAGAPFAHLFVASSGDWSGTRLPAGSIRVMDDATFKRGNYNPEEGGPKGLTVSPDGSLLCVTDEEQPLVFIDIREDLERAGATPQGRSTPREFAPDTVRTALTGTMQRTRDEFSAALRREKEAEQRRAAAEARAVAAEGAAAAANERIGALTRHAEGLEQIARDVVPMRDLAQRAQGLEQRVDGLSGELRSAQRKVGAATAQAAHAKRRVQSLLRSSSWRLTAPFRALKRRFSRR
jgi:DNA-binding beta-propeller fold protein YncE